MRELMENVLDVLAKKHYRIPNVWERKRWFSEIIRKTETRRDITYKKILLQIRSLTGCNIKSKEM